jgi:hypothetical protein
VVYQAIKRSPKTVWKLKFDIWSLFEFSDLIFENFYLSPYPQHLLISLIGYLSTNVQIKGAGGGGRCGNVENHP